MADDPSGARRDRSRVAATFCGSNESCGFIYIEFARGLWYRFQLARWVTRRGGVVTTSSLRQRWVLVIIAAMAAGCRAAEFDAAGERDPIIKVAPSALSSN